MKYDIIPQRSRDEQFIDFGQEQDVKFPKSRIIIKKINKKFLNMKSINQNNGSESNFRQNINRDALSCFAELCQVLSCSNRLRYINLSRCNLNIYYSIELANLIQRNQLIETINLSGCMLNSFSLSCIFKSMIDHSGLRSINLSQNPDFTPQVVQDFCKYVLQGNNKIAEINLSSCKIDSDMSIMFPNIIKLKSLRRLNISSMNFKETIIDLGSAMLEYTGNRSLDMLDISNCNLGKVDKKKTMLSGISLLSTRLALSVRPINIKSLNLSNNQIEIVVKINQKEKKEDLEKILLKMKSINELNLSYNIIHEFQMVDIYNLHINKLDLSGNYIKQIPQNFFLKVLSLNLTANRIDTQGAYQISQVLISKGVQWVNLNLNRNLIKTKGFISLVYALVENQSLLSLSVSHIDLHGEGILVYIFNHEQLRLQYLDISNNPLRYDLVNGLLSMMKQCNLKTLILSQTEAKSQKEQQNGQAEAFRITSPNLQELDLSSNPNMITPIMKSLSQTFNRIHYLNLSKCVLFPDKKQRLDSQPDHLPPLIGQVIEFISKSYMLQTLILSFNRLGLLREKHLMKLGEAFSKSFSLTSLDLSGNILMGNKVLSLIDGLVNCSSLKFLDLSSNYIYESDTFFEKFPQILDSPNLIYINLHRNYIKAQTLIRMKQRAQDKQKFFPQITLSNQRLTADDLLAVAEIAGDFQFRQLNISQNFQIDLFSNFFCVNKNVRIESLTVNKVRFHNDAIQNMERLIEDNKRYLRIIEISNIILFDEILKRFLRSLRSVTNLMSLILDYQTIKRKKNQDEENDDDDKDEVVQCFRDQMQTFKNLRHFTLRKSNLNLKIYEFLSDLLEKSVKLTELDLSDNRIPPESLKKLNEGLLKSRSLKYINLSNQRIDLKQEDDHTIFHQTHLKVKKEEHQGEIKLDDVFFSYIVNGLFFNNVIKTVDLSQNQMSMESLTILKKPQKASQVLDLKLKQLRGNFLEGILTQGLGQVLSNLRKFDISENKITALQLCKFTLQGRDFCNLEKLSLEKCFINDEHCEHLGSIMSKFKKLTYLNLRENKIRSRGFEELFNSILQNKTNLQFLNLSKNEISDEYFETLEFQFPKTHSLKVLLLDKNKLTGSSHLGFRSLLKNNFYLYIYTKWSNISEELAMQIVEQYIQFTSSYNQKKDFPYYLQKLKIINTQLSDNFFIWFGAKFFKLPKLEQIKFIQCGNKLTTAGKMHMYISLLNENLQNYNLKQAQLDDDDHPNFFDDGISAYYLKKLKSRLTDKQNISIGAFGEIIKHFINRLYNWLQNLNEQQFRTSSQLNEFLRKRKLSIKVMIFLFALSEVLRFILSGLQLMNISKDGQIYKNSKLSDLYIIAALSLIIIMDSVMSMIITVKLRMKALPDYCIITKDMKQYMHKSYPHNSELFLLLMQIICQLNYVAEFKIMQKCIQYLINIHDFTSCTYNYVIILIIMSLLILFKFIFLLYNNVRSTLQLLNQESSDHATYLSKLWKKAQHNYNYNIMKVLSNYCPQSGIYIRRIYFSYKQVHEIVYALFFELLTLACLIYYHVVTVQLLEEQHYSSSENQIMLLIAEFKCAVKFMFNFFNALTTWPPEVKVHDINEALVIRRYQSLGNISKLSYKPPPKIDHQYSNQEKRAQKVNQDFKFHLTKSERNIDRKPQNSFEDLNQISMQLQNKEEEPKVVQYPQQYFENKRNKHLIEKYSQI